MEIAVSRFRRCAASLFLIGSISIAAAATGSSDSSQVRYDVSFPNAVHHEAEVQATFNGINADPFVLIMSQSSPGRYARHDFAKNIYNVKITDAAGRPLSVTQTRPARWEVSGHGGRVQVRYTLFADRADGTYSGIDETHAHLNMPATFVWGRGMEEAPVLVTFHRPDEDWKIATQLVPTDDPESFAAPGLQYFMDSPTEISQFELLDWKLPAGQPDYTMRLAIHHSGSEAEAAAFAEMAKAVTQEQRQIFGEFPHFDHGTYTFLADYLPYVNGDGMEHRNSTVLTSTNPLAKDFVPNLNTLSHEFFHCWNVERIRPRSLEPFDFADTNQSDELWFAEGFTSYYDDLVLRRIRAISLDRYAEGLGALLNSVLNAPGTTFRTPVEMSRLAPLVDGAASVDPNNRANTFVSYYNYGAVIGLGLDLTLRTLFKTLDLDQFMRRVWEKHGQTEIPYRVADLQGILADLTNDAEFAEQFFTRYINGHDLIDYAPLLAEAGLELQRENVDSASLGEVQIRFEDGKVSINSPPLIGSPLYEAGLERGDVLLRLDGREIQSREDLDVVLEEFEAGKTYSIEFRRHERERESEITLSADSTLEVVSYESLAKPVTQQMLDFREAWLGPKSELPSLQHFCAKCKRAFALEYTYCPFDGSRLQLTREGDEDTEK